jgi:multimeric flavodoxin WrbA
MKILSVCGSPRKGNSEAILNRFKQIFEKKGIENEIILLREKNIEKCEGCVEYCNHNLKCHHKDDMAEIMQKMLEADGYVFVSPNYFAMPPGIFKDFIDKCSIFYTAQTDLSSKKALIISIGTDLPFIRENVRNLVKNFCKTLKIKVVDTASFLSKSELKGNYNDIFENNLNKNINKEIEKMADRLIKSISKK